jgi:hypothetical protein
MGIAVKLMSVDSFCVKRRLLEQSSYNHFSFCRDRVKVGQQPFCSVCDGHIIGRFDMRKTDIQKKFSDKNIHKNLDITVHTETITSDFTFDFHVHVQKTFRIFED